LKILVTFALETEFAPWRAMHNFRREKWGAADAYLSEISSAQVGVVLTGVGPRQARLAASGIMQNEPESIDCCVSSGLAGGLRPEYQIGQVLAARSVYSEGLREGMESQVLESSSALVSFAGDSGATLVSRFYSAEHIVARADEKRHLGASADAVEMESFEVMREMQAKGIPSIAIRAISDTAEENLPLDMSQVFTDEGQVSIPRVLGQVVRKPQSLPGLVRLGKNSRAAAESLARFLDSYVLALARKMALLETKRAVAP
jgi:adenosylhomocysteine nucleosidase